MTLPVALTSGDLAGVGGEIAMKAWRSLKGGFPFFLIGDAGHMQALGRAISLPVILIDAPDQASDAMPSGLPVLHHALPHPVQPGRIDPRNAAAVIESIERGVAMTRDGSALALCTNPINKKALQEGAGFAFPGHTEFLAHLCGAPLPVMMLAAPALRVIPVTIHIPLAAVPDKLTPDLLAATLRICHGALIRDFGLADPRIAVAGLNPHAGEGGIMGREEIKVIEPVISRLRDEGLRLTGPHSADTLFHPAARAEYDVAVCMYHDQALIPIKTLAFDEGVNVTLGLPFIRASPDHGTAYDIAGKGIANPASLIAALRLAREMAARRTAQTGAAS